MFRRGTFPSSASLLLYFLTVNSPEQYLTVHLYKDSKDADVFNFFHSNRMPELFWHTDLHSHVCPGIDDGSPNREQSVNLVRGMWDLGFRRMIVTPHATDELFPNTPEIISVSYLRLIDAVKSAGIDMQFNYSAEYRIDELLKDYLDNGLVRPLPGGRHLLVECGWSQPPYDIDGFIYRLRDEFNLIPVLAHPERYPYYQHHPEIYEHLHNLGVMFQVNLLSLAGHYDKNCKHTAEWLLSNNLIEFIGSDLHRMSHLESLRHYFTSRDYRKLEAKQDLILNDIVFDEQT